MSLTDTSRYMSLILRHKPETIGISLDEHGWANVDELISGIAKTHEFDMDILEEIVRTDNKQRYSFNEDKLMFSEWENAQFLFELQADDLNSDETIITTEIVDNKAIETYWFFAIELNGNNYTKKQLSEITREIKPINTRIRHAYHANFKIQHTTEKKINNNPIISNVLNIVISPILNIIKNKHGVNRVYYFSQFFYYFARVTAS